MPKSSRKSVCNLFYGYQAKEIMRVCVVSKATAQHFKRGSRLPSPQALRLWWLHVQGRILGFEWRRLRVSGNALVDEAGNPYREAEIAAIPIFRQQIAELERQLDLARCGNALQQLEYSELQHSLHTVLDGGARLLKAIDKIPLRTHQAKRGNTLDPKQLGNGRRA